MAFRCSLRPRRLQSLDAGRRMRLPGLLEDLAMVPSKYLLATPIVAMIGPLLGFAMLFGLACALMDVPPFE
jgi:hypothetical protein